MTQGRLHINLRKLSSFSWSSKKKLFWMCLLSLYFSFSGYYKSLYILVNHRLPSSLEYSDAPSVPLASTLLEHILKPLHFTYSSCTTGARFGSQIHCFRNALTIYSFIVGERLRRFFFVCIFHELKGFKTKRIETLFTCNNLNASNCFLFSVLHKLGLSHYLHTNSKMHWLTA